MEQIIIMVILAIVSSLFSKSKNKEQKQMPPFNKGNKKQVPFEMQTEAPKPKRPTIKTQSFEDFAREFLGEKTKVEVREERVEPTVVEVMEQVPSYVAPPLIPTEPPSRTKEHANIGRMAAGKKNGSVTTSNKALQLPTSKKALMQAVVMAEVLGPPKAKRK